MTWHRVVTLRNLASIRPDNSRQGGPDTGPLQGEAFRALERLAKASGADDALAAVEQARAALGEQADACSALLDCLVSRAKEISRLRELAGQDELTGVANRRAFNDALQREASRCKRVSGSLAVLYVDLDGLKSINDRHGHRAGDEAIRALAQACVELVRGSDLVARLGGDEFAVLLPDVDRAGAEVVRDRLRERIECSSVYGEGLRASIGLAVMEGSETSSDSLIATADAELYRDKHQRKSLTEADLRAA